MIFANIHVRQISLRKHLKAKAQGRTEDYLFFGGGGDARQLFATKYQNIVSSAWSNRTVLHF